MLCTLRQEQRRLDAPLANNPRSAALPTTSALMSMYSTVTDALMPLHGMDRRSLRCSYICCEGNSYICEVMFLSITVDLIIELLVSLSTQGATVEGTQTLMDAEL